MRTKSRLGGRRMNGVQVKPVVDLTKLGIAALTGMGAMLLGLRKIRRIGRR